MAICPNCGYANIDNAKFCMKCGTALFEQVPVQQVTYEDNPVYQSNNYQQATANYAPVQPTDFPGAPMGETFTETMPVELVDRSVMFPDDSAHPQKKKKKKILLFSILGIVALLIVAALIFVVPYAPSYFDGNSALESKDYEKAISYYEKADGFLDSEDKLEEAHYKYAEELSDSGKYDDAALHYAEAPGYEDSEDKIFECGEALIEDGDYSSACTVFDLLYSDESKLAKSYAQGMNLFESESYLDARDELVSAGDYKDADTLADACYLKEGDKYAQEGHFDNAMNYYKKAPSGFEYDGVSVSSRIATIENNSAVISLAGKWKATSTHTRSSNGYMYWYHEQILTSEYITMECKMDSSGNLVLSGTVYYPLLPEYNDVSEKSVPTIKSESFWLENVTSVPSKITLSDNSSLTYTDGNYKFYYSDRNSLGHTRMVNVTYSK